MNAKAGDSVSAGPPVLRRKAKRMGLRHPRIWAPLAAAGLIALAALAARGIGAASVLEIHYEDGGKESVELKDGTFAHHYIHSIHTTAVDEFFAIHGNRLLLTGLAYDSYGVGMPSDEGLAFELKDNRFHVKMERYFDRLDIRVSHVPGHGVVVDGILRPFSDRADPETLVTLRAGHRLSFSFRRVLTYERNDSK